MSNIRHDLTLKIEDNKLLTTKCEKLTEKDKTMTMELKWANKQNEKLKGTLQYQILTYFATMGLINGSFSLSFTYA